MKDPDILIQPVGFARYWTLEEAQAHLREVVRLARNEGPQYVGMRESGAVVVMSIEDLAKLRSTSVDHPLVNFADELNFGDLDLEREEDPGRDVRL